MYGPISKDGPALEFGEIGEEIKEEVRQKVAKEVAEKIRGKIDAKEPEDLVCDNDSFWSEENQEHLQRATTSLNAGEGEEHGLIEGE